MQRIRERRVLSRARAGGGSASPRGLDFGEQDIIEAIMDRKVPTQMQHCILKVYKKAKGGNRKEKYIGAFNICAATFSKHKYQKKDSLKLTAKGIRNNRRHQREKEATRKRVKWKHMNNQIWGQDFKRIAKDKKSGIE